MDFIIGYAGIPSEIYDEIIKNSVNITGINCTRISRPKKKGENNYSYSESDANYFMKEFAKKLKDDHENKLSDTGFGIIYINHDEISSKKFEETFFPSTLCVPINWNADESNNKNLKKSIKELENLLRISTNEIKNSIPTIKKEVKEGDSRTPLLLPIKNFKSKNLIQILKNIQSLIPKENNKQEFIKSNIDRFVYHHPRMKPTQPRYTRNFFMDDHKIEFNPPGAARHGFPRSGPPHSESCFVSGHRRLGAPYDHAFHYDCIKGSGNLKGSFGGCHGEVSAKEGSPHLNISPNDFIRP